MIDLYILTATLNSEKTILRCIESVDKIKGLKVQHVILDGGSKDSTCLLVEKKLNSARSLNVQTTSGLYPALNELIGFVPKDKHFIFLHSDDFIVDSEFLKRQFDTASFNRKSITYSDVLFSSHDNKIVREWKSGKFSKYLLYFGWMPPHITLMMTRHIFEIAGYFDEDFKVSGDYHQFLKI